MSDQAERIIALALLLANTRRGLTREEIREQIQEYPRQTSPSFERMFERDKSALRAMGLELITESDEFDDAGVSRYRVDGDRTYLAQIDFTADEVDAIVAAAAVWGHAQWFGPAREALAKLPAIGSAQSDAVGGAVAHEVHPLVERATELCDQRRAVRFDYLKPDESSAERRTIDPWAVVQKNGNWYLVGLDHVRQDVRSFRLSRVQGSLKPVGKAGSYQVPDGVIPEDLVASEPLGDPVDVTLRLRPERAWRLRQSLGIPGSDVESTVPITGLRTLVGEVLSLGDAVEVVAPPAVRSEVEAALAAVLDWQTSAMPPAEPADVKQPRKRPESSEARVRRILALVPWVSGRGGVVPIADAAAHFGISEAQLRSDVELINCTEFGEYHRTVDIDVGDSSVRVHNAMGLDRPMQLTGQQATILLAGLQVLSTLSVPLNQAAIESAAEKLSSTVGTKARAAQALRIATDSGNAEVAAAVTQALQEKRRLRFRYQNSNRDEVTERVVDPIRVHLSRAHQYLTAWCTTAQDERTFRLDRMLDAEVSDELAHAHDEATWSAASTAIDPAEIDGEEVTAELAPSATWWCEYVPHTGRVDLEGGGALITLPVSQRSWLIGSILTLRGGGRVISPLDLGEDVARVAADALAQYRS